MNDLRRETDDVLRRARFTEPMSASHRRRLKVALLAKIAAGGAAAITTEGVARASASVWGWGSLTGVAAKGAAAVAVVASIGVGSYLAVRTPGVPPAGAAEHAIVAPPEASRSLEAPRLPAPDEPAVPSMEPAPITFTAAPSSAPRAKGHARGRAAMANRASPLSEETRLLRSADRALRAGDTGQASTLLDEHASRFPNGVLAPERSAERILLSCQSGQDGTAAASQFLSSYPGSPLAARLKQACGLAARRDRR